MSHLVLVTGQEYFAKVVEEGFSSRKVQTFPQVQNYLVSVLTHYVDVRNLYEPEFDEMGQRQPQTLAEMYLTAQQTESSRKIELLKKMGDKSLYISGFFGDSLQRKLVDIDYYARMGGMAFAALSSSTKEDINSRVYAEISHRFLDLVEVLTFISQSAFIQNNSSVLRLYDRYLRTGSNLAREKLIEMGVLAPAHVRAGNRKV